MHLYLIRHAETVDNVAGLYAGTRDSALTVHGSLQADRLGRHFASRDIKFSRIWASDLIRAVRTAEAIAQAQGRDVGGGREVKIQDENDISGGDNTVEEKDRDGGDGGDGGEEGGSRQHDRVVEVVKTALLREQDFGSMEGVPFYSRPKEVGGTLTGKENERLKHMGEEGWVDGESKVSVTRRADEFLDLFLVPLLLDHEARREGDQEEKEGEREMTMAVVSHGITLSHLWRALLRRFGKGCVRLAPEVSVGSGGGMGGATLEHLGGWGNTGFLELQISKVAESSRARNESGEVAIDLGGDVGSERTEVTNKMLEGFTMVILTVNGKEHLTGLKRTRGVGSSRFDEGQRKIENFFKRTKI